MPAPVSWALDNPSCLGGRHSIDPPKILSTIHPKILSRPCTIIVMFFVFPLCCSLFPSSNPNTVPLRCVPNHLCIRALRQIGWRCLGPSPIRCCCHQCPLQRVCWTQAIMSTTHAPHVASKVKDVVPPIPHQVPVHLMLALVIVLVVVVIFPHVVQDFVCL
jgi:hypothetical protein